MIKKNDTQSEIPLKPCPFCGSSELEIEPTGNSEWDEFAVCCQDCGISGPDARIGCRDDEEQLDTTGSYIGLVHARLYHLTVKEEPFLDARMLNPVRNVVVQIARLPRSIGQMREDP